MKGYKYSNVYNSNNKSNNLLTLLSEQSKKKDDYEPHDFYYPIKYEPKNLNYGSVSFRSKSKRFENIKPTPHELDLEPYINNRYVEHRVLNRPWLQQIQATLNDVFINDHTNDGIINSSAIINSLQNENIDSDHNLIKFKSNQLNNKKIGIITSKYDINSNTNTPNSLTDRQNDDDLSNEDKGKKKNKNPYSECYFIKEPYQIITGEQPVLSEEEEKLRKYMALFGDIEPTSPTTQITTPYDIESPDNFKDSTSTTHPDLTNTDNTIENNNDDNDDNDDANAPSTPPIQENVTDNEKEIQSSSEPNEPSSNNDS